MKAYADTTHFIIKGELKEEQVKEQYKEKIVFKEHRDTLWKTEYKDKIVEKQVKYVPKIYKWSLAFSIVVLLVLGIGIYLKISKANILSMFKK